MKYKVVAFDWDGTLVDSVDHIVRSMKQAAAKMSLDELPDERVRNIVGLGMTEAIQTLYATLADQDVDVFRSHYGEAFFATEVGARDLFPHVNIVLEQLSERGVRLAVATGKSRRGLDIALKSTGLQQYFSIERCADETKSKPHPLMLNQIMSELGVQPHEMLMVGDTDFDMEMAQRAGVDRMGVSFGAQPRARLEKYQPIVVVDSLNELAKHLMG
ncbi:HAD family hydrolase [Alkalimarinus alittae]|uniref:HAD-IA family hydrolase n=1 Tax=Alkalimarinus alittae TaxID=2961619 RepID=A0ABY6MY48_9ALTE|nr:HAD-IA family hydrolase [Alkalimarinus alittae]UZE94702.1 HAD-IA family hydrolase [Alkalimarinus alittae]